VQATQRKVFGRHSRVRVGDPERQDCVGDDAGSAGYRVMARRVDYLALHASAQDAPPYVQFCTPPATLAPWFMAAHSPGLDPARSSALLDVIHGDGAGDDACGARSRVVSRRVDSSVLARPGVPRSTEAALAGAALHSGTKPLGKGRPWTVVCSRGPLDRRRRSQVRQSLKVRGGSRGGAREIWRGCGRVGFLHSNYSDIYNVHTVL
jgi:hypothetical protein